MLTIRKLIVFVTTMVSCSSSGNFGWTPIALGAPATNSKQATAPKPAASPKSKAKTQPAATSKSLAGSKATTILGPNGKNIYKGSVSETERLKGGNSTSGGLSRIDLQGNDFSSDDGNQDYNRGKTFSGGVSSTKPKPKTGGATKYTTKAATIDPDASLGLDLEWDTWHKELAEEVFARFDEQAQIMFGNSPPLAVQVAYVVHSNGTVNNIRILKPSKNPAFDSLVVEVIRSISGDFDLLQFPPGSRRKTVEKISTFTQNFGAEGFRSTTGDREKIQGN